MKTKKVRILSSILALAILVCSLSVVSGFVTTAETNSEESQVIANLKTAWQSLYTNETIAGFPIDKPFMYLQNNTYNNFEQNPNDEWVKSFSFDTDAGTFNKTTTTSTNYNRALAFRVSDGNLFNKDLNNNDSLYFTFNPGTVKASGNLLVILQYNGYGDQYALCAEVPFTAGDNEIHIEKLTYRCPNSSYTGEIPTFSKLSDILQQFNSKDLHSVRIMFDKDVNIEGATISALQGAKYATLPADNENLTALQWYNAAKDLDVSGYENAAAFTTALNNLKTYLSENDPNFVVSELKTAWQSLSINSSIAEFPIASPFMYLQINTYNRFENDPSDEYVRSFSFNTSAGTFNKTTTSSTNYNRGLAFRLSGGNLFDINSNSTNSNAFNNAFNNNDSLYFTFNPGTVNASGNLLVILQYKGWGDQYALCAEVPFTAGNNEIHIEKLTYRCPNSSYTGEIPTFSKLSDILKQFNGTDLHSVRIMFDKTVNIEGATISALKGAKYATLPEGNGSFTPLEWYNAAKDLDVNGYENAVAFTTAL